MDIDQMTARDALECRICGDIGLRLYVRSQWPARALMALTAVCLTGWFVGLRQFGEAPQSIESGAVLILFAFLNIAKYKAWKALASAGDLRLARRWTNSTYALAIGLAVVVMAV